MLLVEYSILDNVKVINESKNGVTKLRLLGKFQKCDEQNNNGRVYPRKILESQVKAIQEKIGDRSLVGALDHPANDAIHLSQASHLITKLWVEKNGDVMGEAEILSTPNGKIVKALIGDGVKIGISSRGLGSVSENSEGKVVNEDFKLITFDLVSDPSTKGAFPELTESMRENSNRAQTIISKHKKERVLMTMLESKITQNLEEGRDHARDAEKTYGLQGEEAANRAGIEAKRAAKRAANDDGYGTVVTDASVAAAKKAAPGKKAADREEFHKKRVAKVKANKGRPHKSKLYPDDKPVEKDPHLDDSTILRDFVVNKIKEAFKTSQREGLTGPVPETPANAEVNATKKPTPAQIKAARDRDRRADAKRAADPKTPGRNKRQLDRINTAPRGREKDVVEANVHDVDDTSKQRLQRRGDVVRGRRRAAWKKPDWKETAGLDRAADKAASDHTKAMKARMAGTQKERPRGSSPNFRELRFKNVPGENAPRRDSTELFRNDIINRLKEALRVNSALNKATLNKATLNKAIGVPPEVPTLKRTPVDKNAAIRKLNRDMGAKAQKVIDKRKADAEARNRGESPN